MRKSLYCFLLFCYCLHSISYAQPKLRTGIIFFKGDWKSLLKEAHQKHKLIFVDVYTDWCTPCKRMEKEVFPLVSVGKTYNDFFINYRLNAERGEGIGLAVRYAVKGYPTYLFLDSVGNLLYRSGDYLNATDFTAAAHKAIAQNGKAGSLAELDARFKKGDRGQSFLKALLEKRTSLDMDNADILNAYVAVTPLEQLNSPTSLLFLSNHMGSTVSTALPIVLNGLETLDANTKGQVANKLYNDLLYYALGRAIKENRLHDANTLLASIQKISYLLTDKNQLSADNLALHYYQAAKDTSGLKFIGYRMAAKQLAIPIDSIRLKDKQLYAQAMEPFFSGKLDSATIPGFQDEKKMAAVQYSANVASTLYTIANAFKVALNGSDKSLNDALHWTQAALRIYSNKAIVKLQAELEAAILNK